MGIEGYYEDYFDERQEKEKFKRKRKWEIIKDKYMTIDLISLLLDGKTIDEALTYTNDEYSIPLMDWAG